MKRMMKRGTVLLLALSLQSSVVANANGLQQNIENSSESIEQSMKEEREIRKGWYQENYEWYYYNEKGQKLTGWQFVDKHWYYLDGANAEKPGVMIRDCKKEINGKTYYFGKSGAMCADCWYYDGESWYYIENSGLAASGWKKVGNTWYYLNPLNENRMEEDGWKDIYGKKYYLFKGGSMASGWLQIENEWYYLGSDGAMKTGWQFVNGCWYYLNPSNENKMEENGWKWINNKWYYLYKGGAMAENWLKLNGEWYYLGSDGAMKTGWQLVGGRWYYMYTANDPHGGAEGVMARNTTIDGYQLSGSGAMLTAADIAACNILNTVGWNLQAAFNWSAGMTYQKMTADASPGSEWFALYGFQNGKGNCYAMAATFCYMARQLGYEAHQMTGGIRVKGGGTVPHSWCEVIMGGKTYVFDPDFTNETGRNGYQITYGQSGTWMYANYSRMN